MHVSPASAFPEFENIYGARANSERTQLLFGTWMRRTNESSAADRQRIGRECFAVGDRDADHVFERAGIDPRRIYQEMIRRNQSGRGFQMQAAMHRATARTS